VQDTQPTPPGQATEPAAEPTATAASGLETPAERLVGPDALLLAAEQKVAELNDAWLRAKAETENLRRRAQEDIARAHKYAAEKFAAEMLPVKDSLEAALAAEGASAENLRNGVELTLKQLVTAFEKSGLTELNPLGEKFDPNLHQAISTVAAEGEANRVLQVLQKGYALNERVLRPALVIVSRVPDA